jgi:hypothetical protein
MELEKKRAGRPRGTTNANLGKPPALSHKERQIRWRKKKQGQLQAILNTLKAQNTESKT